eukprot:7936024-Prorocentrum_lima.AAC.1
MSEAGDTNNDDRRSNPSAMRSASPAGDSKPLGALPERSTDAGGWVRRCGSTGAMYPKGAS